MQPLLIRADANVQIGSGHVMRCLALAQAWQDQAGDVTFLCAPDLPAGLQTRLASEGMTVQMLTDAPGSVADAEATIALARALDVAAVVVDGYHFGAAYQKQLKEAGLRVLFIDDNGHAAHYTADWVLNQNIHADAALYANREPYTQLLLGTQYTLLRREFWAWRGHTRDVPDVANRILVTMGGSDPDNVTLRVLQALQALPDGADLHIKAVIGASNPHRDTLQAFVDGSPLHIELLYNVTDMPEPMAWADVAISAGGSTISELSMMGTPILAIVTAMNQSRGMAYMAFNDMLLLADPQQDLPQQIDVLRSDKSKRQAFSIQGMRRINARGSTQVINIIRSLG